MHVRRSALTPRVQDLNPGRVDFKELSPTIDKTYS